MPKYLSLWDCLGHVVDPRNASGRRYSLQSVLALIIAGLLCGKTSLRAIARWGSRLSREELKLIDIKRKKAPSQTAVHNLLVRLEPQSLDDALHIWAQALQTQGRKHISIDGKSLKASATNEYPALHLLAAYCHNTQAVLAQRAVDIKKNEFVCARDMLFKLPVSGCIISGDAMFCQRELSAKVCEEGGDYMFIVKANQPSLQEEIRVTFDGALSPEQRDTQI